MIQVATNSPNFLNISSTNIFGGQEISVSLSSEIAETVKWVKEHRQRLDMEADLRSKNPALASAWDTYQVMLRLVMDET